MWPTPTATLGSHGGLVTPEKAREGGTLIESVSARTLWPTPWAMDGQMFPTPAARDWEDNGKSPAELERNSVTLATIAGGSLNPTWVEWLMGFPPNWTEVDMPKKNTLRKAARKATAKVTACQVCGATGELERHHPDYSRPELVEVLCPPCHIKADQRDGTRATKQPKKCAHCGNEFIPTHSKKHSLCSDECRRIVGRMNAEKRWGKSGTPNRTSDESLTES
jgi:hypothetical protein